jgi:hypothetical protein
MPLEQWRVKVNNPFTLKVVNPLLQVVDLRSLNCQGNNHARKLFHFFFYTLYPIAQAKEDREGRAEKRNQLNHIPDANGPIYQH